MRPTAWGSAPSCLRQKRPLTTTTGGVPGLSVAGPKNRPAAGFTPKVEKYSGETRCP